MEFKVTYRNELVDESLLVPGEKDKPDYLYNLSKKLKVTNPAIIFTREAKSGAYNSVSDEEYDVMLKRIKFISKCFFDNKPDQNLFMLVNTMMDYIMKRGASPLDMKRFGL